MSNLQLYIAVGLPTIAVITSAVISLVQISDVREDLQAQIVPFAKIAAKSAPILSS